LVGESRPSVAADYLEEKYGNDEEADQKPKLGKVADLPHP